MIDDRYNDDDAGKSEHYHSLSTHWDIYKRTGVWTGRIKLAWALIIVNALYIHNACDSESHALHIVQRIL